MYLHENILIHEAISYLLEKNCTSYKKADEIRIQDTTCDEDIKTAKYKNSRWGNLKIEDVAKPRTSSQKYKM